MTGEDSGEGITVLVVTADPGFTTDCRQQLPAATDADVVTAGTVGEAIDHLGGDTRVDCIVSDHDLPDTDGIAFLEAVRAQAPTLPFILFTSEGSEAAASKAISAGVTEYLIKERHADQYDRLATLIEDAVAYARDHADFVNTEARAKTLLDAARDTIIVVRDDHIQYLNATGVDLLGVDNPAVVAGDPIDDHLTTRPNRPITAAIAAVQTGEQPLNRAEADLAQADGTVVPVEVTATPVEWAGTPAVVLVVRDIRPRKERTRQLDLQSRAMEAAPIGITIADATQPDNPLIYVNDHFLDLTGYAEEEVLGRNCRFLQGEATSDEPVAQMRAAIDAAESVTVDVRNYRTDGTEFWNRVTIAPITDAEGAVTHYVGFQQEVTAEKQYEYQLLQFKRAVEAAGHAVYITDPDGTITYVNPAFERITGYDRETAVGQTPRILKSGEMPDGYYDDLWATLTAGEVWDEEILNERASGELYNARQTIAPVTDDSGEIRAFVAVQTDITDRKEREQQLHHYERAIEGATDLIVAVDTDYRLLFANASYRHYHGLADADIEGTHLAEVLNEETWETVKPSIDRGFAGESGRFQMTRPREKRPDRTFDVRYYPLDDPESGAVVGVVATMRDLTEQQERERQLQALDRMLRHNLHNEMNLILGYAEMIAEGDADDAAAAATTIWETGRRLLAHADKEREIVEVLADPSPAQPLDLSVVVERAVSTVERSHPEAEVVVETPAELVVPTVSELERAVEELVENAVVHSERAAPEVGVRVAERETSVEITVSDEGPGIPAEEQAIIGGDEEIDPLLHSSGMGLWLVEQIMSRAGGKVRFEAAEEGSVVTLVVPRRQAPDATPDGTADLQ